jgi:hypothetical protein
LAGGLDPSRPSWDHGNYLPGTADGTVLRKGGFSVEIARVRSEAVWQQIRIVFIGSALLFGINIYFGFANVLTEGPLPRGQLLIHLHAGSVGWITLSAIGIAIWLVTGRRFVSAGYERAVRIITWTALIAFAGYVPNFWLAFLPGEGAITVLLPIFGSASVLVLWTAAIFVTSQLGREGVLTNPQILAAGALVVAAIGATVGALLGLERVIGQFLPLPDAGRVGAHAGMMDTYLFLVAAALVEWMVRPAAAQRRSPAGIAQAGAWVAGATLVPIAFFLDAVAELLPIFGLLLLAGLAIFLVRTAWRAIAVGPTAAGVQPWAFFGTAWLIAYMGLFLYAVGSGGDFAALPSWFGAVFVHAGFVGMMTNLLLGAHSARAAASRSVLPWAEPAALWIINLGLVVFLGLKVAADIRFGALLMGLGVILGVATMVVRLWSDRGEGASVHVARPAVGGGAR